MRKSKNGDTGVCMGECERRVRKSKNDCGDKGEGMSVDMKVGKLAVKARVRVGVKIKEVEEERKREKE